MQHLNHLQEAQLKNSFLTIGVFDGLHLGHQSILKTLTAAARLENAPAVLLTFNPHPAVVLGKPAPKMLTTPAERAERAALSGLDLVITQPFTPELAATNPEDYMALLKKHLGLKKLFVGYDFALGRNRAGDVPRLTALGHEMGYQLLPQSAYQLNGMVISSTAIRQHIAAGEVAAATKLLGYEYALSGEVMRGDGRGRTIGIPTANLQVPAEKATPANGVYACRAYVGSQLIKAVVNIGVRPTFTDGLADVRVEAHLLDFEQDLYGQTLKLAFVERLRGEIKFDGFEALVKQIHADIAAARQLLGL